MKIAHEMPLCLMSGSSFCRLNTDYDYALVHLFEENVDYYNYFVDSLNQGREVILDNSIFELNEAFDAAKFAKWIKYLNPTVYIIPDALDDTSKTIGNYECWVSQYSNLPGKRMVVIQGKNKEEAIECYKYFNNNFVHRIGFSFNSQFFDDFSDNKNIWLKYMEGRQNFLNYMIDNNIINYNKEHHLLGAALPQEFKAYKGDRFKFLTSLDTSNPVIAGMFNIRYSEEGLLEKNTIKLFTLINSSLNDQQIQYIKYNIDRFRSFCND